MPSYLIAIVVGALESRYRVSHLCTGVMVLPVLLTAVLSGPQGDRPQV